MKETTEGLFKKMFNRTSALAVGFSFLSLLPVYGLTFVASAIFDLGSGAFISFSPDLTASIITLNIGIPLIVLAAVIVLIFRMGKKALYSVIGYLVLVTGISLILFVLARILLFSLSRL